MQGSLNSQELIDYLCAHLQEHDVCFAVYRLVSMSRAGLLDPWSGTECLTRRDSAGARSPLEIAMSQPETATTRVLLFLLLLHLENPASTSAYLAAKSKETSGWSVEIMQKWQKEGAQFAGPAKELWSLSSDMTRVKGWVEANLPHSSFPRGRTGCGPLPLAPVAPPAPRPSIPAPLPSPSATDPSHTNPSTPLPSRCDSTVSPFPIPQRPPPTSAAAPQPGPPPPHLRQTPPPFSPTSIRPNYISPQQRRRLRIGNLPLDVKREEVEEILASAGITMHNLHLTPLRDTTSAWLTVSSASDQERLMSRFHKCEFRGQSLYVERERLERPLPCHPLVTLRGLEASETVETASWLVRKMGLGSLVTDVKRAEEYGRATATAFIRVHSPASAEATVRHFDLQKLKGNTVSASWTRMDVPAPSSSSAGTRIDTPLVKPVPQRVGDDSGTCAGASTPLIDAREHPSYSWLQPRRLPAPSSGFKSLYSTVDAPPRTPTATPSHAPAPVLAQSAAAYASYRLPASAAPAPSMVAAASTPRSFPPPPTPRYGQAKAQDPWEVESAGMAAGGAAPARSSVSRLPGGEALAKRVKR